MKPLHLILFIGISLTNCIVGRSEDAKPAPAKAVNAKIVVVTNESGRSVDFTAESLAKLPQTTLTVKERKGDEAQYSGVPLNTLLKESGAATGAELKGKLLANRLLIEAADNYRVVFSLPEVDPVWTDKVVLLATHRNGEPFDAAHGPFQIVISGEKMHSRWVKQVIKISIRSEIP